ncbi:MAG: hypothetical protein ACO3A8_05955 [Steroidobacteraceae bacterium]|jgi:hypothetical protein|nr:hypothetical protein [Gammaproteobacteria bacterium]
MSPAPEVPALPERDGVASPPGDGRPPDVGADVGVLGAGRPPDVVAQPPNNEISPANHQVDARVIRHL